MYYFNYFIRCIIRQFTRLLFKPKYFFTILIVLLISFLLINSDVFAVYEGDDTYTDKNNTIVLAYDTINNDLINRLSNCESSTDILLNYLKNSNYDYYCYYGSVDGSTLINGSTYNTSRLYIAVYDSSTTIHSTTFESYQGIQTSIYSISPYRIYYFENNDIFSSSVTNVLIPNVLISYKNYALINYINNSSNEQTNNIISAIEDSSKDTQNVITENTDKILSEDVSEDSISIVEDNTEDITAQGFDNIFTIIMSAFLSEEYKDIVIPLPHNSGNITIPSNFLENALGSSSWLVSFIHLFYYFLLDFLLLKIF